MEKYKKRVAEHDTIAALAKAMRSMKLPEVMLKKIAQCLENDLFHQATHHLHDHLHNTAVGVALTKARDSKILLQYDKSQGIITLRAHNKMSLVATMPKETMEALVKGAKEPLTIEKGKLHIAEIGMAITIKIEIDDTGDIVEESPAQIKWCLKPPKIMKKQEPQ